MIAILLIAALLVGSSEASTSAAPPWTSPAPVLTDAAGGAEATPDRIFPSGVIVGRASWFCRAGASRCHRDYPDTAAADLYAAAGPALRRGNWRGSFVRVSHAGRSVTVRLIDWCLCGSGRAIDLYADSFSRLAPLSRGVIEVSIQAAGPVPTPPATDTEAVE